MTSWPRTIVSRQEGASPGANLVRRSSEDASPAPAASKATTTCSAFQPVSSRPRPSRSRWWMHDLRRSLTMASARPAYSATVSLSRRDRSRRLEVVLAARRLCARRAQCSCRGRGTGVVVHDESPAQRLHSAGATAPGGRRPPRLDPVRDRWAQGASPRPGPVRPAGHARRRVAAEAERRRCHVRAGAACDPVPAPGHRVRPAPGPAVHYDVVGAGPRPPTGGARPPPSLPSRLCAPCHPPVRERPRTAGRLWQRDTIRALHRVVPIRRRRGHDVPGALLQGPGRRQRPDLLVQRRLRAGPLPGAVRAHPSGTRQGRLGAPRRRVDDEGAGGTVGDAREAIRTRRTPCRRAHHHRSSCRPGHPDAAATQLRGAPGRDRRHYERVRRGGEASGEGQQQSGAAGGHEAGPELGRRPVPADPQHELQRHQARPEATRRPHPGDVRGAARRRIHLADVGLHEEVQSRPARAHVAAGPHWPSGARQRCDADARLPAPSASATRRPGRVGRGRTGRGGRVPRGTRRQARAHRTSPALHRPHVHRPERRQAETVRLHTSGDRPNLWVPAPADTGQPGAQRSVRQAGIPIVLAVRQERPEPDWGARQWRRIGHGPEDDAFRVPRVRADHLPSRGRRSSAWMVARLHAGRLGATAGEDVRPHGRRSEAAGRGRPGRQENRRRVFRGRRHVRRDLGPALAVGAAEPRPRVRHPDDAPEQRRPDGRQPGRRPGQRAHAAPSRIGNAMNRVRSLGVVTTGCRSTYRWLIDGRR